MLQIFRIATISIIATLMGSCATTSISSYTDPAFANTKFSVIAIWVDSADLEWRQDLESFMHDRVVTKTGAAAIRVIDIAPPTRDYDSTEVFQLMGGAGAKAVIVVTFTDTGVAQSVSGNQYGVYTSDSPWAQADVTVFEVESGAKVWTGTAKTQGDDMSDWATVRRSAGSKIVEELLAEGLLPPPDAQ